MPEKLNKTNAMRQLDTAKIPYEAMTYPVDESDLSGVHIAEQIGLPTEVVFKTLVARGDKTGPIVLVIPCAEEIDLKRAAAVTGNKKIEMVAVKDLLGLTGYIRGGCSPVGMKKRFRTWFDRSVTDHEKITVSAGVRGCQLLLKSADILRFTGAEVAELTVK
ncbi:MAG: Cys-tRNA(Pro) deacylase [Clostridia bacterium]|nr:Cys-tRNA(Pro) deacylase [Clostridia bacterium]